ncbi:MAG TPA: YceI family protein [candidate division Zixibacteria bacterium]|nr:YceI family protein [candidate division Zixibacteria bacterium]
MRKISATILSLAAGLLAFNASAHAAKWGIDRVHSSVGFKVSHLVISKVTGSFSEFDGTIEFDESNLSGGAVEFTVQVASIDTDNEKRDNHLRSADFFDAANHPTMTFKSTKVSAVEDGKFSITGNLTIRGTTKEVTFDCEYGGSVEAFGGVRTGFSAQTKINRFDYGLAWDKAIETGGLVVGDEVTILIELELGKMTEPENPCNP